MGGGLEGGHLGFSGAVNSGLFVKVLAVTVITFELLAPNNALSCQNSVRLFSCFSIWHFKFYECLYFGTYNHVFFLLLCG